MAAVEDLYALIEDASSQKLPSLQFADAEECQCVDSDPASFEPSFEFYLSPVLYLSPASIRTYTVCIHTDKHTYLHVLTCRYILGEVKP